MPEPFRRLQFILCVFLIHAPATSFGMTVEEARQKIVESTLTYLNIPYLWGGKHPVTGLDCSGFVSQVFRDVGLSLPDGSRSQFANTVVVNPKEVLPGDIIFFSGDHPGTNKVDHVGIYVGRGLFVHASPSHGVKVEKITKEFYFNILVAVHRYKGF